MYLKLQAKSVALAMALSSHLVEAKSGTVTVMQGSGEALQYAVAPARVLADGSQIDDAALDNYVQHFYQVDDTWYQSPKYVNVQNITENWHLYMEQPGPYKRWNPELFGFTIRLLGTVAVDATITLGHVVGVGAIGLAAAAIWKGIDKIYSETETKANSAGASEDIFVDIQVDKEYEIKQENGDPNDLERRAMTACAQSISDQKAPGGCCRVDLHSKNQAADDLANIVGLVENGVQLSCPKHF